MSPHNSLQFVEYVNDPIWGEVPLTRLELDLINTRAFRRLQHIRQMGLAYLAFPTANHRRFEHSIGTMHVASKFAELLVDLAPAGRTTDLQLTPLHLQTVRVSALLHDLGHAPYSHAFEEAVQRMDGFLKFTTKQAFNRKHLRDLRELKENRRAYSHELFSQHIIRTDREISDILTDWTHRSGGFEIDQLALLSSGQATHDGLSLFNLIISGDFDADRIDYICRDSYYCGFHQRFDLSEFRRGLILRGYGASDSPYQLVLSGASVAAMTSLLWYRHRMMTTVHLAERNRIATCCLIEALRTAFSQHLDECGQKQQRDRAKLELLCQFHMDHTDEACAAFLTEYLGEPAVQSIAHGSLPVEVQSLTSQEMTPEENLFAQIVLQDRAAVSTLQDKIRERFGDNGLIVDLQSAKAPRLDTSVKHPGTDEPRNIYADHHTARGIVLDAIGSVSLTVHHSSRESYDRLVSRLRTNDQQTIAKHQVQPWRYIVSECLTATRAGLHERDRKTQRAHSLEFLLCVLAILNSLTKDEFGQPCWIAGDGRFQAYVRRLCARLARGRRLCVYPEHRWQADSYSVAMFRDLEILTSIRLVNQIYNPIIRPKPGHVWADARLDRMISTFGMRYYQQHLLHGHIANDIEQIIERDLHATRQDSKGLMELESQLHSTGLEDARREAIYDEMRSIRSRISKDGSFVVLSTGRT
jgi:HD superfamily phosphohydrolase